MKLDDLYTEAKQIAPWMVENRRALHRIPEGGFCEFKTQAYLLEKLKALGYDGALTIEREISGEKQIEDIIKAKALLEKYI